MENKTTYLNWNVISEYVRIQRENHNARKTGENILEKIEPLLGEPYNWDSPKRAVIGKKFGVFNTLIKYCKKAEDKYDEVILLKKVFDVMNNTPQHTYQIVTNVIDDKSVEFMSLVTFSDNIVMKISYDKHTNDSIIDNLAKIDSKHNYLSITAQEYISKINFNKLKDVVEWIELDFHHGNLTTENYIEDILKLKKNCDDYNIPFSFKSWGKVENNPNSNDPTLNPRHRYYNHAGCMLDDKIYHYDPTTKTNAPTISLFGNDYYVMDELDGLSTIWELKSYLPFMQDDLFQQLKEDIRQNGLNDPILYYLTENGDKLVIEGHTRLKACVELNLTSFPIKEIQESFNSLDSIKLWMLKHQFQRRNLSAVERLELAYLSKDIIERQAKENLIKAGKGKTVCNSIDTSLEIANLAGVGRTTAVNYTAVMNRAPQAVIDKLKKGDITIAAAYNKVREKSPKMNSRISKPEIRFLQSFDEGKELLGSGDIDGIVILNNMTKVDSLTSAQKSRFGVLLINLG
ncbi:hypothetical protein CMT75_16070 [Elizabethkingia anophelis]|nr:hypothetical protein [Elizabethkingia anophelis]